MSFSGFKKRPVPSNKKLIHVGSQHSSNVRSQNVHPEKVVTIYPIHVKIIKISGTVNARKLLFLDMLIHNIHIPLHFNT